MIIWLKVDEYNDEMIINDDNDEYNDNNDDNDWNNDE